MKANQVYSFFKGFKFSKNFLLMNYKLNKILSQTIEEECRPFTYQQLGTQALHQKHTF
jgi:hypothetical protein